MIIEEQSKNVQHLKAVEAVKHIFDDQKAYRNNTIDQKAKNSLCVLCHNRMAKYYG